MISLIILTTAIIRIYKSLPKYRHCIYQQAILKLYRSLGHPTHKISIVLNLKSLSLSLRLLKRGKQGISSDTSKGGFSIANIFENNLNKFVVRSN